MKSPIYDFLRLLERRAMRRAPQMERLQVKYAIYRAVDAAIMDAHLSGRVYAKGGEVASPGDEHRDMLEHAHAAAAREYVRGMREWES
jgi:hypothetical protein